MSSKAPPDLPSAVLTVLKELRRASGSLRRLPGARKNELLQSLADSLLAQQSLVLKANNEDLARLAKETPAAFRDRLTLNSQRIGAMVESLRQVAALPDPVGEVLESKILNNGLKLRRVRAPLGVLFMIFESRPNVILEASSLAFKSGNTILLRGGSESRGTAKVLYQILRETLRATDLTYAPVIGLEDYDRGLVEKLLRCKELIDVVIPRGGDQLIAFVQQNAQMPIIKNDRGMCHALVDADADLDMALTIVLNAKTQRPGVCNALETVLVHKNIAALFLPRLLAAAASRSLRLRADAASMALMGGASSSVSLAQDSDWDTEYLDLILNCRLVDTLDEALLHIEQHGSHHSEAIITNNTATARRFQDEVDAAVVYWNASTRFTDGFEFGLGGELGISTQKLHVRGPVGLRELTTPRWLVDGSGQVRE